MTVGEKIQFHRKRIKLSQEELGQKLFVSRQTVSLWEMDKTLPTIDNLIRLKEIFSVSIDDILSEDEIKEDNNNEATPLEAYTFKYKKEDLQEVFKKCCLPQIKQIIIFSVGCIVLFFILSVLAAPDAIIGLILGYFICGILAHIKGYFRYKKAWKSNESRLLESIYFYEIFDDCFTLHISRNGDTVSTSKHLFDSIEKIQSFESYLILQISNQVYIIKKDELKQDSKLIAFCNATPDKVEREKNIDGLKIASIILYVLSIFTIFGALMTVALLTSLNEAVTENMWAFFLFLPIPIASIVLGFFLKKRKYKYKGNIIVGLIMSVILCIYGSFTFIFANVYSHSDEPILNAEELLDIDIPAHSNISTQDLTQATQAISRGYVRYISNIRFDASSVVEFEKKIGDDEKWISEIPNDMIGITSHLCDYQASDFYIIYNIDTKEFNTLPRENGTYAFINILYDMEYNKMTLVEYEIEYTK